MDQLSKIRIKVFDYVEELDCFIVRQEFKVIADKLQISEWNEVVWIGRYFALDNDYGEHWLDNWDEREAIAEKAQALGISDEAQLLIISPKRFKNGGDGPCHSDEERKQFWHDVLFSLQIRLQTLFNECLKKADGKNGNLTRDQAQQIITILSEKYSR